MRRAVVRLIAVREARDQFRDRRTMFLILGLPVLMYPLFVGVGTVFVSMLKGKQLVVGVVGAEHLPQPGRPGPHPYPPLLVNDRFPDSLAAPDTPEDPEAVAGRLTVTRLAPAADAALAELLAAREVDAVVVVEPGLADRLERGGRPVVRVLGREGEENSKLAVRRVMGVLRKWTDAVKTTRFARHNLPADFDSPIEVRDPQSGKPTDKKLADELRDVLVKVIPLLLAMWVLTGAIYPAIDMTAGEKERGTMETLLISPAERTEIVAGKFLAVAALAFGTAVWNVLLMVIAVGVAQVLFPYPLLSLAGLAACVIAALPVALLLAAGCITLGVFARSTKEGNYYMVPMFFLVLPLAYWSMAPGIELDGRMSWVPITNALLVQQRLLSVRPDPFPWQHVPAVVLSMSACIGLALWAAVVQFRREAVLFREAEQGRGLLLFGRRAAKGAE
ncbi:ABC transporter permease [bacterium]|nr:ABC transporter permease [bacterium]